MKANTGLPVHLLLWFLYRLREFCSFLTQLTLTLFRKYRAEISSGEIYKSSIATGILLTWKMFFSLYPIKKGIRQSNNRKLCSYYKCRRDSSTILYHSGSYYETLEFRLSWNKTTDTNLVEWDLVTPFWLKWAKGILVLLVHTLFPMHLCTSTETDIYTVHGYISPSLHEASHFHTLSPWPCTYRAKSWQTKTLLSWLKQK